MNKVTKFGLEALVALGLLGGGIALGQEFDQKPYQQRIEHRMELRNSHRYQKFDGNGPEYKVKFRSKYQRGEQNPMMKQSWVNHRRMGYGSAEQQAMNMFREHHARKFANQYHHRWMDRDGDGIHDMYQNRNKQNFRQGEKRGPDHKVGPKGSQGDFRGHKKGGRR